MRVETQEEMEEDLSNQILFWTLVIGSHMRTFALVIFSFNSIRFPMNRVNLIWFGFSCSMLSSKSNSTFE